MGVAAEKRYRKFCENAYDCTMGTETQRHNREVIDRMNSLPRGASVPFGPVVIVPPQSGQKVWWLQPAGLDRDSRFGYHYKSFRDLISEWSIIVVDIRKDRAGIFFATEPHPP